MKKNWQHIVSFILLIAIMFPLCFVLLSYSIEMRKVKRKAKWKIIQGIPLEELVYFEYDMQDQAFAQLEWEHDREFEYRGNMFDVVKADTVGTLVRYYCYPDHQETALNKRMHKQLDSFFASDKHSTKKNYKLNNLITNLYIVHTTIHFFSNQLFMPLGVFFKYEKSQWQLHYKGPPPKRV